METKAQTGDRTWLLIHCSHCRNDYMVRADSPPASRRCPLCRGIPAAREPGSKIRRLLEGRGS